MAKYSDRVLDWRVRVIMEKRFLGLGAVLVDFQSPSLHLTKALMFSSASLKEIASCIGAALTLDVNKVAGCVIGTAAHIAEFIPATAYRPFSIQDVIGAPGEVSGYSRGFAFGYANLTVSAEKLFTVAVKDVTASMIWQSGHMSGSWRLLPGDSLGPDASPKAELGSKTTVPMGGTPDVPRVRF